VTLTRGTNRIEILTIGDELIEGRLVDTNAAALSERLDGEGYRVVRHTSVGDDLPEVVTALRQMAPRCDVVLVSGGLGPTGDDLTAACAAEAFGVPLVRSPEALRHVRDFFAARGRPMSPNNEKQADLPAGAAILPNPSGTAVGFAVDADGCRLYFMPGVPREIVDIFETTVLPELRVRLRPALPDVAVLKIFGAGESDVARRLEGLGADLPEGSELVVQYRATFPEIHVRLVLRGIADDRGNELLAGIAADARQRLGRHVYAWGPGRVDTTFAESVVEDLQRHGTTLAAAEGCTAGAVAQLLDPVAGVGEVYLGGVLAPTLPSVSGGLDIPPADLERAGLLSDEAAVLMAEAVRRRFSAGVGVATVGTASAADGVPAGTAIIAVAAGGGPTVVRRYRFPLEPARFEVLVAYVALGRARRAVTGK